MAEYLQEVYWLAAYSLLRWGEEEPRAADVALMVLGYGGIGMCMLRDDPKVVDSGCDEDFSYRNLCDHLRDLRIQADLDYACNADLAESMLLEYPACMDARYLYDAGKSWKRIVLCGTSRLNQLRKSWNAFTRRARIR